MRVSGDDIIIGKTCLIMDDDVESDAPKKFTKKDCSSALRYVYARNVARDQYSM